jgi:hypothetical protein
LIVSISNGDEGLRESSERILEMEEREEDNEEKRARKLEMRRTEQKREMMTSLGWRYKSNGCFWGT